MSALGHNGGPVLGDDESPLRIRVIRIDIDDWQTATRGLSCEEEGFYWRFHMLLYGRMGAVVDDDQFNARSLNMDVRQYRRLRARLVEMGKIQVAEGRLTHPQIVRQIEMYLAEFKRRSESAQKREAKRRIAKPTQELLSLEIGKKSPGSPPDFSETSGRLFGTSARSQPELNGDLFGKPNEINGSTATTVHLADARNDQTCHDTVPSRVGASRERAGFSNTYNINLSTNSNGSGRSTDGKNKNKKMDSCCDLLSPGSVKHARAQIEEAFETFWRGFPGFAPPRGRKTDKAKARDLFVRIVTSKHPKLRAKAATIIDAAQRYAASQPDPEYIPMPTTWLNGARWEDVSAPADNQQANGAKRPPAFWWRGKEQVALAMDASAWKRAIANFANGTWPIEVLGPPPGTPECIVPPAVIEELRLTERYDTEGNNRSGH